MDPGDALNTDNVYSHTGYVYVICYVGCPIIRQSKLQTEIALSFYNIRASARPMAAFSGFYESHGPTPLGNARGIVPERRHGHRNGQ